MLPEYILGRSNEATQVTGFKNSKKKISMSPCVFFYGWLLEIFGVLLAPFQTMYQHHKLCFSTFWYNRIFVLKTEKIVASPLRGREYILRSSLIILLHWYYCLHVMHKIYKHKLVTQLQVCVFTFCQYSPYS